MILRPVAPPVEYGITKRLARAGNAAIAFLRSLGTSAHVWLPGANGVSVASLPSNNYLLSDGSTGYSTVDGVDGLTLDGMGSLGSELVGSGAVGLVGAATVATYSTTTGVGTVTRVDASNQSFVQWSGLSNVLHKVTISCTSGVATSVRSGSQAGSAVATVLSGESPTFFITPTGGLITITSSSGTAGFTVTSFKEYTGTHLTQPTTANKPLVRRGAYNLLKYSEQFGNAAWAKTLSGSGVLPVVTDNYLGEVGVTRIQVDRGAGGVIGDMSMLDQAVTSVVGVVYYGNCEVKATAAGDIGKIIVSRGAAGSGYRAITLTANWQSFGGAETATSTAATFSIGLRGTISSCSQTADFLIRSTQHTSGAAAEDYTTTTATAASNPTSGKYWWSFDGSNDSLLSGNLGITNACTIVIAGRVNSLSALQVFLSEDTNGAAFYVNADGSVDFSKTGVAQVVATAAGVIVAGVPFVITTRLSSGTAVIRKNGVQVATAASGLTFSAVTGARIGTSFNGTSYPVGGALGWVVALPVALSDADCLTVERLVGTQFPGMATF